VCVSAERVVRALQLVCFYLGCWKVLHGAGVPPLTVMVPRPSLWCCPA
jgi:hypothetical protein